MLDPRTLISLSKRGVAKVERGLLLSVLKEEYVKYGSQAQLYQQERKAASITDGQIMQAAPNNFRLHICLC
jgi:hypothetical protein